MWVCFRYLFIYIYPVLPDSGGKLFFSLLRIIMFCMIIAEFTILGLLGLKESAVAPILMIPLLIVTVLFNIYVKQKHFSIAEHLPAGKCLNVDLERKDTFDTSFLRDAYLHPHLKVDKELLPGNSELVSPPPRNEEAPDHEVVPPPPRDEEAPDLEVSA
jgi:hypothetical protein